jgi:hypothetical protein
MVKGNSVLPFILFSLERRKFMFRKNTLFIFVLILYPLFLFSQYFDRIHEMPKDEALLCTYAIKTHANYHLFYSSSPHVSQKYYFSQPLLAYLQSSLLSKNGDSITTLSYFLEDTTIQRYILSVHSQGKYFIGVGAYSKVEGKGITYDIRGWMVKIDTASHQVVWEKTVGDTLNNYATIKYFYGGAIMNPNLYVGIGVGYELPGKEMGYLHARDSMGNALWSRYYDDGGVFAGKLKKGIVSGNYLYSIGYRLITSPFDTPDSAVIWLLKTDIIGNKVYEKHITVPGFYNVLGENISMTSDKHLLIGALTNANIGPTHALVLKTDTLGNVVWRKVIPSFDNKRVSWASMTHQAEERANKQIWALVRNNDPDLFTSTLYSKTRPVLWLYCLDSMGNEVWKRKWRRANDEYQHLQTTVNMVLEEDGGAFIAFADANSRCCPEYTNNHVIFEPHYLRVNCAGFTGLPKAQIYNQSVVSNVHTLHTKIWNTDSLIIEWGDGVKQRFSMIDTVYRDTVFTHTYPSHGIFLQPNIKAYACGYVYESNGLGVGEEYVHIQPQEMLLKTLSIHPNPAQDYVWLVSTNVQGNIGGKIVNMQGQTVKTFALTKDALRLDIQDLPQGIYFVQVQGYNVQKLVRQ